MTSLILTIALSHAGGLQASAPTALDCLPGTDTCYVRGLNNGGAAVGDSYDGTTPPWGYQPTLWDDTGATGLDQGLATTGEAFGLNDNGQVIGRLFFDGDSYHGAAWDGGTLRDFGSHTGVTAINGAGQISGVGHCEDPDTGMVWKGPKRFDADGSCEILSMYDVATTVAGVSRDINASGTVVGYVTVPLDETQPTPYYDTEYVGFRDDGTLHLIDELFPGITRWSTPVFITDAGGMSGVYGSPDDREPFVVLPGDADYTLIGLPGGSCPGGYISIEGHNEADQVLMKCGSAPGSPLWMWSPEDGWNEVGPTRSLMGPALNVHGAVASNDQFKDGGQRAYVYLDGEIVYLEGPDGTTETGAYAINDANQVGGYYVDASGNKQAALWQISDVPPTPQEQIDDLAAAVDDLVAGDALNGGQGTALNAKLDVAKKKLDQGKPCVASNLLDAFVQQVEALTAAGILTAEEAQALVDAAAAIQDDLLC